MSSKDKVRSSQKRVPVPCQAVCESSQLVPSPAEEEQQEVEVSTEEELPWVLAHCQAEFESGGGSRPPKAPELRVRPPQVGGLAKDLGRSLLLRSPFLRAWPWNPQTGPSFGLAPLLSWQTGL